MQGVQGRNPRTLLRSAASQLRPRSTALPQDLAALRRPPPASRHPLHRRPARPPPRQHAVHARTLASSRKRGKSDHLPGSAARIHRPATSGRAPR